MCSQIEFQNFFQCIHRNRSYQLTVLYKDAVLGCFGFDCLKYTVNRSLFIVCQVHGYLYNAALFQRKRDSAHVLVTARSAPYGFDDLLCDCDIGSL